MNFSPHFKSILTILVFLLLSADVFPAKFKVESFKKDEADLAARRFERQDINGETCALIKIKTDLQGLKFQSGFGIVGDVLFQDGQYWVYVSPSDATKVDGEPVENELPVVEIKAKDIFIVAQTIRTT